MKHSNLSSLPDDKLKTSIREQAAKFDIAGFGYQQFDLADLFDVFSNPHGLDTVTDEDRLAAKAYQVSIPIKFFMILTVMILL